MWTRRRLLVRSGLTLLGGAGVCFAFPGDGGVPARDGDALPDGSAARGMFPLGADRALERALTYLHGRRHPDGSFGTGAYEGNVAVTSLSALAFMAAGSQPQRGPYGKAVTEALRYVLTSDATSGRPGFLCPEHTAPHGPMYAHGFGTLFLAEASGAVHEKGLRRQLHDKLRQAVQVILDAQNHEGGWRYDPRPSTADISVTVCQMMALRAARNAGVGVPKSVADECVKYVKRCQDRAGGWFRYQASGGPGGGGPQSFARTAAGVAALNSAGVYKGEEVEKGLKFLLANKPPAPGRGSGFGRPDVNYFYGHYYAVQAMWTAGGDRWAGWFPQIRDELLDGQRPDGGWIDANCPHYATAMACLILQVPNNYLPILQK
jgi:hypothetical protein